jgi:stress-induced-phosphoprotein 1
MVNKEAAAAAKAKGNAAFSAKNYEEGIKHFTEAIGHDPTDHVFYSNRSACYASSSPPDYTKALADGEKCVSIKPDWPKGYSRKGLAEFNIGKLSEAEATYAKGLELAPQDAALLEGAKNVKDALASAQSGGMPGGGGDPIAEALMSAMTGNPQVQEYMKDQAFAQTYLAILQAPPQQKQMLLLQAVQKDQRFAEILMGAMGGGGAGGPGGPPPPRAAPKKPEPEVSTPFRADPNKKKEEEPEDLRTDEQKKADEHKLKANDFYKKRKFDEAIAEYDLAISAEPNDATYHNNKAAVLLEQAKYDECLKVCQNVIDNKMDMNMNLSGGCNSEKIAKIYCRMASCFSKQKLFDKAIEMYNKALVEDNNKTVRNGLRDCEKAKDQHEKDSYLDPAKAEEHRQKGNDFFKAQKWVEAKQEYDEGIRRNPKDAKLYSNRAACLNKLGAAPDSLRDLDECLKLDPTFVRAYARKGQAHALMKEYHKALKAYEAGLKIEPDNAECQQGKQSVMYSIQASQSNAPDQEQVAHAMADPEIQDILKDPQINIVLQKMQEDPSSINEFMKDQKIAEAINKLIAGGILKVGGR